MSSSNHPRASDPGPDYVLSAPAAQAATPQFFPPGAHEWPSLNDRLAEPETPEEVIRGERYYTMGAQPPHADQHFRLDYVLAAHVRPEYVGATDLLTRARVDSDFASDTCIRKAGDDPATGTRWLEEIAFEIVNEQPLRKVKAKAEDLSRRGVRRIFAIFVKSREVKEWSMRTQSFESVNPEAFIHDERCLIKPLPVKALVDPAEAHLAVATGVLSMNNPMIDNTVANVLLEKRNPVLVGRQAASKAEGLKEPHGGFKEGEAKGQASAIVTALCVRGIPVNDAVRSRIQTCTDLPTLNRWFVRALQVSSAEDVIAD